jgi:hypothetical protein
MSVRHPVRALALLLAATALALAAAPATAIAGNGCGPAGFGPLVPDRAFGADFEPACDRHDECYATPWRTTSEPTRAEAKLGCDSRFLADLEDACFAAGARQIDACLDLAAAYHRAVRSWLGDVAYAAAQS